MRMRTRISVGVMTFLLVLLFSPQPLSPFESRRTFTTCTRWQNNSVGMKLEGGSPCSAE